MFSKILGDKQHRLNLTNEKLNRSSYSPIVEFNKNNPWAGETTQLTVLGQGCIPSIPQIGLGGRNL